MGTWSEDIELAVKNLGGVASLSEIYAEVKRVRKGPYPSSFKATIRGTIENNSSDSAKFKSNDIFFSVNGLGSGVWGLLSYIHNTPEASDIEDGGNETPRRETQETYRILRDTRLARQIKLLHKNKCQICGKSIALSSGESYSEAHHIKPLGKTHNGPDVAGNIIVLCPNHHVMLDYGVINLEIKKVTTHENHKIQSEYIEYHNSNIWQSR
ncbi:HNH endonuclease [Rheinheimera sp. 1928-s]|uniref:HNH endonuclease n=1 Tax=Rheinheimera sp. 1928-s TaxID=3033803 RepID=UPI0026330707|nr:HNH endonuclease [Rheinheimera sp. 1928-s]MDF3127213.1 HNH endonuclease [Rheinheimera sp. 1928-s]